MEAHPSRPLHQRLHDESRDRVAVAPQHGGDLGECGLLPLFVGEAVPNQGNRQGNGLEHHPVEGVEEPGAPAHTHRPNGIAMIAPPECGKETAGRAAVDPMLVGDLESRLDRGGAVVGVEDLGTSGQSRLLQQALGKTDGGFVGGSRELHMVEPLNLPGDSAGEFGSSMSVEVHPPGGDHVEVRAALRIDDRGSLAPGNGEQGPSKPMLGEGMPDRSPVTIQKFMRIIHLSDDI